MRFNPAKNSASSLMSARSVNSPHLLWFRSSCRQRSTNRFALRACSFVGACTSRSIIKLEMVANPIRDPADKLADSVIPRLNARNRSKIYSKNGQNIHEYQKSVRSFSDSLMTKRRIFAAQFSAAFSAALPILFSSDMSIANIGSASSKLMI